MSGGHAPRQCDFQRGSFCTQNLSTCIRRQSPTPTVACLPDQFFNATSASSGWQNRSSFTLTCSSRPASHFGPSLFFPVSSLLPPRAQGRSAMRLFLRSPNILRIPGVGDVVAVLYFVLCLRTPALKSRHHFSSVVGWLLPTAPSQPLQRPAGMSEKL